MAIFEKDNIFILETKRTHYVMGIDDLGLNRHIHWGKKCSIDDYEAEKAESENLTNSMLDEIKQEYTVFGGLLYRECSLKAEFADRCRELSLKYSGSHISGDSLALKFSDEHYPLSVTLHYQVSYEHDIITRYTTVKNTGDEPIMLNKIASAEFSLPSPKPYTFKNTNGSWYGEFTETDTLLEGGLLNHESRKGISGPNHSPSFIAYQNADEKSGDVYFASLAYSGNFKITAVRDLFGVTRVIMGINDFDFAYELAGGEALETPRVFCGMAQGFGEMTRNISRFAIDRVLPAQFAKKPLPVLYNSWEATYFDVSCENQTALARRAAEMGVELFVMDDGWFGRRNDDHAGLGDWYVNREKFPNGLTELIRNVNELGMDFGLWVEPEMVNPDSDLFRAHPDWAYRYEHRTAHEYRHQLVLNMTRTDVQEYIFNMLDALLTENNIKYIKWDMNRPFSETGAENLSTPQSLWYLHTQAVYAIVDRLKAKHPCVAFESCASGGGRSDLGALSHYDQVWPSDNTDGIDRMTIQKGYSRLHPAKTMRAWVTDIAGLNKPCSLQFRFNIAMQGALGIGGNLAKYSEEELAVCRENIALYKEIRHIVQFGDLYRIMNIEDDEILVNQYVTADKTESVVFIAARGTSFCKKKIPVCFDGLKDDTLYSFTIDGTGYKKHGAYLKEVGIPMIIRGADYNKIIKITAAD